MIGIEIKNDMSVINTINRLSKNVDDNIQSLNTDRGTEFRETTIELTRSDQLGLTGIDASSKARRKADIGGPLYDEGELLHEQKIHKEKDKSVEVGYFENDTERHSDSNVTNYQLAKIHTTGIRTKTGRRPRPFMHNSAVRWERSDRDETLSEKYLEGQIKKSNV